MDTLFSNITQIISTAAQSQLGIFALLAIALSLLAYTFFSAASEIARIAIFTLLFLGVAAFGVAMFWAPEPPSGIHPASDSTNNANVNAAERLLALKMANVDFSVREEDVKGWVNNKYTLYPVVSIGLLELLNGKPLAHPVYLDVIVYNYEHAAGASAPSKVDPVDPARLKAAVLDGYNGRHGSRFGYVKDFEKLLR